MTKRLWEATHFLKKGVPQKPMITMRMMKGDQALSTSPTVWRRTSAAWPSSGKVQVVAGCQNFRKTTRQSRLTMEAVMAGRSGPNQVETAKEAAA